MLTPVRIIELSRGIEATFADGHRSMLSFEGKSCTCGADQSEQLCPHITASVNAYKAWKWRTVDGNESLQGRLFLQSIGIDPAIFNPLPVDWRLQGRDARVVWRRLWRRQAGWLFQFDDGAFFALLDDHPDGMTKCSVCRTRDCRHVREGLAAFRLAQQEAAV